jgi:hypothetical protein
MTKAIVLCSSHVSYIYFCRHFGISRFDLRYATDWSSVCGYHWNTPVIIVEGYHQNRNYTLDFMNRLHHRFDNIGFLSTGEIYNDN